MSRVLSWLIGSLAAAFLISADTNAQSPARPLQRFPAEGFKGNEGLVPLPPIENQAQPQRAGQPARQEKPGGNEINGRQPNRIRGQAPVRGIGHNGPGHNEIGRNRNRPYGYPRGGGYRGYGYVYPSYGYIYPGYGYPGYGYVYPGYGYGYGYGYGSGVLRPGVIGGAPSGSTFFGNPHASQYFGNPHASQYFGNPHASQGR